MSETTPYSNPSTANSSLEINSDLDEDLGPPLDLDALGNEQLHSDYGEMVHTSFTDTGFFDELRQTPEYLNEQPYRRRQRTNLVLQKINGHPVLLSERRLKQAEEISQKSLFSQQISNEPEWENRLFDQSGDTSERFYHPEIGKNDGLQWKSNSRELTFLIRHLDTDRQKELGEAYSKGEKIKIRLLWGPRWKITRFGDETKLYEWPRDDGIDDPNDFRGSNFVVFTKVSVERDTTGELVISEKLLVEANLFTKTGSTRIHPKGSSRDGVFLDRSIEGLKRRAEEGDIYLTESERLYNQAVDLHEDELSRSDEQWIRNGFIDFMSGALDRHTYSVKGASNMRFRLNGEGEVVIDGDDMNHEVRFSPVRVNVKKGGYLARVLQKIVEQSHALNRNRKYSQFQNQIYPVFKEAIEQSLARELARNIQNGENGLSGDSTENTRWQAQPHAVLARQLTHSKAMLSRFIPRSSSRNLGYILHFFSKDSDFDQYYDTDVEREALVFEAIRKINQQRRNTDLFRAHFNDEYIKGCLDRIAAMKKQDWLPKDVHSGLVLPISVDEPTLGVNRKRIRPDSTNKPNNLDLFKKSKEDKSLTNGYRYLAPVQRDHLIGFDIYPAQMSVDQVRNQVARYGVDIIQTLVNEGDRPAIYALYMDSKQRTMSDGSKVSPSQWVNMLRRVFDTKRYTDGRSSRHAIESGFKATAELARQMAEEDSSLVGILEYFDYQSRLEATKESKAYSGLAGEVFTRIALNADLATVLGVSEIPESIDYKIVYIDRDRSHQKSKLSVHERKRLNSYISEVNSQNPDSEHIVRPDFIVELRDTHTHEISELWFDSKAYIKKVTPVAIGNLFEHYQPALNHHRKLVIVAHSPMERITKEAWDMASSLGVIIVGSDAIAKALARVDDHRVSNPDMRDLVAEYLKFKDHPSAYSEDLAKRAGIRACEELLDLRHASFGPLFSATERVDVEREKLLYRD